MRAQLFVSGDVSEKIHCGGSGWESMYSRRGGGGVGGGVLVMLASERHLPMHQVSDIVSQVHVGSRTRCCRHRLVASQLLDHGIHLNCTLKPKLRFKKNRNYLSVNSRMTAAFSAHALNERGTQRH